MFKLKDVFKQKKWVLFVGVLTLLVLGFILYPFTKTKDGIKDYYNTVSPQIGYDPVGWDWLEDREPYIFIKCSNSGLKEIYNGLVFTVSENEHYYLELYKYSRDTIFSQEWKIKKNGTAVIYDTTFSKLSEMVEDDCNQFKQNRNKSEPDSDEITWRYYPPQTDEEIREEEERLEAENNERFNGYTSDQITKMIQDNYDSFSTETQEKIEEAPYTGGMQVWADCLAEYGIIDAE